MGEKKKFDHIRVGVAIASNEELKPGVNTERRNDYKSEFEDLYLHCVSQLVPHNKWGIIFSQTNENPSTFGVDIYVDEIHDYVLILEHIRHNRPREIQLEIFGHNWGFDEFILKSKQTIQ